MARASFSSAGRDGFTLLETTMTIAMLVAVTAFIIPTWRMVQLRSDLHVAEDAARRGLDRARFLSQTGYEDSAWGYQATQGIVFRGASFATRDASADEKIPVPATVAVSGVLEVTFSRPYGEPSATGTILLTSVGGASASVRVAAGIAVPSPVVHGSSSRTSARSSSSFSLQSSRFVVSPSSRSASRRSSSRSRRGDDDHHDD